MECENCTKKCPQMALADECAKGRMYATQELIKCQKELEQLKAKIEEIRAKAIDEFAETFIFKAMCSRCSDCCNCFEQGRQMKCEDYKSYMEIAEQLKGGNDHEQYYQGNT